MEAATLIVFLHLVSGEWLGWSWTFDSAEDCRAALQTVSAEYVAQCVIPTGLDL
jgi:hypothetical protein